MVEITKVDGQWTIQNIFCFSSLLILQWDISEKVGDDVYKPPDEQSWKESPLSYWRPLLNEIFKQAQKIITYKTNLFHTVRFKNVYPASNEEPEAEEHDGLSAVVPGSNSLDILIVHSATVSPGLVLAKHNDWPLKTWSLKLIKNQDCFTQMTSPSSTTVSRASVAWLKMLMHFSALVTLPSLWAYLSQATVIAAMTGHYQVIFYSWYESYLLQQSPIFHPWTSTQQLHCDIHLSQRSLWSLLLVWSSSCHQQLLELMKVW